MPQRNLPGYPGNQIQRHSKNCIQHADHGDAVDILAETHQREYKHRRQQDTNHNLMVLL